MMRDAGLPAAEDMASRLPRPPVVLDRPALFLDLDGVLAPLAATPEAVVADARRTRVLEALAERLDGRVAIVSGRSLTEIDRISGDALTAASGVHGLERRRADGAVEAVQPHPRMGEAVAAFTDFARDREGLRVEDKSAAVTLHFRADPRHGQAAEALARDVADRTGLTLQPGKMVMELKTPGADKGTALTAFMAEAPFAGAAPIMLGDDLTDENGFRAARALGGFGVLVGEPRATAARYGLPDVDAVLAWLEQVRAR